MQTIQPQQPQVTLTLPVPAVNYVLQVLGARPHDEVRPLIDSIHQQVTRVPIGTSPDVSGPNAMTSPPKSPPRMWGNLPLFGL